MKKSGKNEYVISKSDLEDINSGEMRASFGEKEDEDDY